MRYVSVLAVVFLSLSACQGNRLPKPAAPAPEPGAEKPKAEVPCEEKPVYAPPVPHITEGSLVCDPATGTCYYDPNKSDGMKFSPPKKPTCEPEAPVLPAYKPKPKPRPVTPEDNTLEYSLLVALAAGILFVLGKGVRAF